MLEHIVLDVDQTLLDCEEDEFTFRPYLKDFFNFLFKNFKSVSIWSRGGNEYIEICIMQFRKGGFLTDQMKFLCKGMINDNCLIILAQKLWEIKNEKLNFLKHENRNVDWYEKPKTEFLKIFLIKKDEEKNQIKEWKEKEKEDSEQHKEVESKVLVDRYKEGWGQEGRKVD